MAVGYTFLFTNASLCWCCNRLATNSRHNSLTSCIVDPPEPLAKPTTHPINSLISVQGRESLVLRSQDRTNMQRTFGTPSTERKVVSHQPFIMRRAIISNPHRKLGPPTGQQIIALLLETHPLLCPFAMVATLLDVWCTRLALCDASCTTHHHLNLRKQASFRAITQSWKGAGACTRLPVLSSSVSDYYALRYNKGNVSCQRYTLPRALLYP